MMTYEELVDYYRQTIKITPKSSGMRYLYESTLAMLLALNEEKPRGD